MKTGFGRIGIYLGTGLFAVLVSFLLLNLAKVDPVIAVDCFQLAIEAGCDQNDAGCQLDYCLKYHSNQQQKKHDDKTRKDNIDDVEDADKEENVDDDPLCLFHDEFGSFLAPCDDPFRYFDKDPYGP